MLLCNENSTSIQVKTDPRVELMSIIFRMAGNPEYSMGRIVSYVQDVDRYLGGSKNMKP
jgi:hypothetical protein